MFDDLLGSSTGCLSQHVRVADSVYISMFDGVGSPWKVDLSRRSWEESHYCRKLDYRDITDGGSEKRRRPQRGRGGVVVMEVEAEIILPRYIWQRNAQRAGRSKQSFVGSEWKGKSRQGSWRSNQYSLSAPKNTICHDM